MVEWLAALVIAQAGSAAPIATYDAEHGGEARIYGSRRERDAKVHRAWIVTNFTAPQVGEWPAKDGESKAYQSTQQQIFVNCQKDELAARVTYYFDMPLATGKVIRSETFSVSPESLNPIRPGSVGESVKAWVCALKR